MVIYTTPYDYLAAATEAKEKIARYKAILVALEDAALKAASNIDITEYTLDDGQSKISTVYRDPVQIERAINLFTKQLVRWENKLFGRSVKLVDSKNFTGRSYGRGY